MSIEEIEIEGNLGQNPKYPSQGYPDMLTFSVGVSQRVKNKQSDEWESRTTWYEVVCWEKEQSLRLFQKLSKGDKVVVKGFPSVRSYIAKDGESKASISIRLSKIAIMKKEGESNKQEQDTVHAVAKSSSQIVEEHYDNQPSGRYQLTTKLPVVDTPIYEDEIPFALIK